LANAERRFFTASVRSSGRPLQAKDAASMGAVG
jgi:hypothetical protein